MQFALQIIVQFRTSKRVHEHIGHRFENISHCSVRAKQSPQQCTD